MNHPYKCAGHAKAKHSKRFPLRSALKLSKVELCIGAIFSCIVRNSAASRRLVPARPTEANLPSKVFAHTPAHISSRIACELA